MREFELNNNTFKESISVANKEITYIERVKSKYKTFRCKEIKCNLYLHTSKNHFDHLLFPSVVIVVIPKAIKEVNLICLNTEMQPNHFSTKAVIESTEKS